MKLDMYTILVIVNINYINRFCIMCLPIETIIDNVCAKGEMVLFIQKLPNI